MKQHTLLQQRTKALNKPKKGKEITINLHLTVKGAIIVVMAEDRQEEDVAVQAVQTTAAVMEEQEAHLLQATTQAQIRRAVQVHRLQQTRRAQQLIKSK
jgi:hypothetical protein